VKLSFISVGILSLALAANLAAQADTPMQVHYAANLAAADSFVNITNTGASGGNICVNIYTFSPDEQLISCCSCVVTPNALASLSVRQDLISNTMAPAVPASVVVKLLATTGGACNAAVPGALANGMAAWGTTVHWATSVRNDSLLAATESVKTGSPRSLRVRPKSFESAPFAASFSPMEAVTASAGRAAQAPSVPVQNNPTVTAMF
jgi:hypothetical protein